MNTLTSSIQLTPLKKMFVTEYVASATDLVSSLDALDNRLSDVEFNIDQLDSTVLEQMIQVLGQIVTHFGGKASTETSRCTIKVAMTELEEVDEIAVVKMLSHPILVPGKSTYTIEVA